MKDGRAIMLVGRLGNIVLMGLLPIALTAPLAISEVDVDFGLWKWEYSREEISISGSLSALYQRGDMLLFYLILCLSVVGPYLRLLLMTYTAFSGPLIAMKMRPLLELVGRFSLIDVIIIALLVISFRVPQFKLQWGFYLILSLWVIDMLAAWAIWNWLRKDAEREMRALGDWPEMEPVRPPLQIQDKRSTPPSMQGGASSEPPDLPERVAAAAYHATHKAMTAIIGLSKARSPK